MPRQESKIDIAEILVKEKPFSTRVSVLQATTRSFDDVLKSYDGMQDVIKKGEKQPQQQAHVKHKRKREAVQPTANKYQKRAELEHEKQEQLKKEEEERRRKLKEVCSGC